MTALFYKGNINPYSLQCRRKRPSEDDFLYRKSSSQVIPSARDLLYGSRKKTRVGAGERTSRPSALIKTPNERLLVGFYKEVVQPCCFRQTAIFLQQNSA